MRREAVAIFTLFIEQSGAKPKGQCQPGGGQAQRLAAIRWWRDILTGRLRRLTDAHSRRGRCPSTEHRDDIVAFGRHEIECGHIGVTLQGCRDPALMRAPERFDPVPAVIGGDGGSPSLVRVLATAGIGKPIPAEAASPAAVRTRPRRVGRSSLRFRPLTARLPARPFARGS